MPNDTEVFDMREALSRPIGDWESRALLPVCHYIGKCIDVVEGTAKTGTPLYGFICSPREPFRDATPEQLAVIKELNLSDYEFPNRQYLAGSPAGVIYISAKSMAMNRDFFETMGFPITTPMDQCILQMRDRNVLMGISQDSRNRPDGSRGRLYNLMTFLSQVP